MAMRQIISSWTLITICLIFSLQPLKSYCQTGKTWSFGVEQDVLPYITGGYFIAAWGGQNQLRGRVLYVQAYKPDFLLPEGFSDLRIRSFAAVIDVFLKPDWQGWWMGVGAVHWANRITYQPASADFKQWLLNGSLGYHWKFCQRFYVSPWAGMHVRLTGDQPVSVGGQSYHSPLFNPEASFKLGWIF